MQDFYKRILDNLFDGVYFVDNARHITYWNNGAQRISGYSAEDVLGKHCAENILQHVTLTGIELCTTECPLSQTLEDGMEREAEIFMHHKDGHRIPATVRITPLHDESGARIGAVEVFSDATEHQRILDELLALKRQTMLDPLTCLGNRRNAALEFERRIGELRRFGIPFGMLFADIDHFKRINDTYGHDAGDKVLVSLARTLKRALREVDTVCRWGGEEFLAIVPKAEGEAFRVIAERMRSQVESTTVELDEGPLRITVSVGGARARISDTLESLSTRADSMMYEAKQAGRNIVKIVDNGRDSAD